MANNKAAGTKKSLPNARKPAAGLGDSTNKGMTKGGKTLQKTAAVKKSDAMQNSKKAPGGGDMVTLTQTEFDAILGAIGKLAVDQGMCMK
jgi:hypothetical protein